MKKSLVLLAGVSMAFIGLPAVSHAQAASGPFADVPTDHWAYASVDTLQKAGIVIGYPDGTYGGRRPMTRYEFAVAIARLLAQMKPSGPSTADFTDLQNRVAGNTAAIDALRTLVNGFGPELTRLGQDVAAANARLDALEARVNALDTRVTNNEGKISSIADELARFHVTGDVNIIYEGDASRRHSGGVNTTFLPFLDRNGLYQGNTGYENRLLGSSDVYNDVLLHIRGKVSENATANVDLDFGNYLSGLGNTAAVGEAFSGLTPGTLTNNPNTQVANVYKAYLDAAVKLGPLGGAELLVGRFGNQYTKWTLKQVDSDVYTNLIQTDSGDIISDGAKVNFKVGPASISGFATKMSATPYSQVYAGSVGAPFTPAVFTPGNPFGTNAPAVFGPNQFRPGGLIASNHALPINDGIGGRATFGSPESANLGFTLEQFGLGNGYVVGPNGTGTIDPNRSQYAGNGRGQANGQYNRLTVYGADFNGALPFGLPGVKKGGILVDAAYTVSAHAFNDQFNNVGNGFRYASQAYNAGFAVGPVHIKGGYQYVGPDFSAPGYWGKLGAWSNPTNVRGPVVSAKFAITPKLSFNADGEFYTAAYGSNANGTPIDSPIHGAVDYTDANGNRKHGGADHVSRYQAGFSYGLSSTYGVDLGYEDVQYDIRNQGVNSGLNSVGGNGNTLVGGRPEENYTTIGLGHSFSPNASIKLLYQIVHYDDKGTGFDPTANGGKEDGSVAAAQFQLKF